MKPVHIAMIAAAAAYLYYITSQRKNVLLSPQTEPYDTGFVAPKFPHTPTPSYAYPDGGWTVGGYEGGMNWPARDNIFG
jgi:hypothetical protein